MLRPPQAEEEADWADDEGGAGRPGGRGAELPPVGVALSAQPAGGSAQPWSDLDRGHPAGHQPAGGTEDRGARLLALTLSKNA